MTISPKAQFIITLTSFGVFLAGTIISVSLYWLPKMNSTHETIHQHEAAIAAIERQQKNLSSLTQQLKERQAEDDHLKKEMWGFLQEDRFFDLWENFGSMNKTTITLDKLADAAPGPVPVQREAALTITGTLPTVLATIAALPSISPVVVVQKVQLSSGPASDKFVAQVTCLSLWYDDTTHE